MHFINLLLAAALPLAARAQFGAPSAAPSAAQTTGDSAQSTANQQQPTPAASGLKLNAFNPLGCYSNPGEMWDMGPYQFQTSGWCQPLCVRQAATYFALVNGTNCFCGNSPPPAEKKVSSSNCNTFCSGYKNQNCGGQNYWAIFEDGYRDGNPTGDVHITTPTQTWFGHAATQQSSTLQTVTGGKTVVVTASAAANTNSPVAAPTNNGPNKAAIAAGVVVGVVGLAAIIGAALFAARLKKQRALDEERRRHESIMRIVNRDEKPSSFAGSDSRLEPSAIFQRRQSDGSIMDNQDYSRRILQVTNPDYRESRLG